MSMPKKKVGNDGLPKKKLVMMSCQISNDGLPKKMSVLMDCQKKCQY
jgi:hypothetical protein